MERRPFPGEPTIRGAPPVGSRWRFQVWDAKDERWRTDIEGDGRVIVTVELQDEPWQA